MHRFGSWVSAPKVLGSQLAGRVLAGPNGIRHDGLNPMIPAAADHPSHCWVGVGVVTGGLQLGARSWGWSCSWSWDWGWDWGWERLWTARLKRAAGDAATLWFLGGVDWGRLQSLVMPHGSGGLAASVLHFSLNIAVVLELRWNWTVHPRHLDDSYRPARRRCLPGPFCTFRPVPLRVAKIVPFGEMRIVKGPSSVQSSWRITERGRPDISAVQFVE